MHLFTRFPVSIYCSQSTLIAILVIQLHGREFIPFTDVSEFRPGVVVPQDAVVLIRDYEWNHSQGIVLK